MSFNNALSTLVAQAHGQNDPKLCGYYANRQIILNILVMIPLVIVLVNIEPILLMMGQEPYIAAETTINTIICLPGYVCFAVINAYVRYLMG